MPIRVCTAIQQREFDEGLNNNSVYEYSGENSDFVIANSDENARTGGNVGNGFILYEVGERTISTDIWRTALEVTCFLKDRLAWRPGSSSMLIPGIHTTYPLNTKSSDPIGTLMAWSVNVVRPSVTLVRQVWDLGHALEDPSGLQDAGFHYHKIELLPWTKS